MPLDVTEHPWLLQNRRRDDLRRALRAINRKLVGELDPDERRRLEDARDDIRDSLATLDRMERRNDNPDDPLIIPGPDDDEIEEVRNLSASVDRASIPDADTDELIETASGLAGSIDGLAGRAGMTS